jgi:hypothetical protein
VGKRIIFAGGRVDLHEGVITLLLSGPGGEVSADIQRRARAVQKRAQRAAPLRTGLLRSSIHVNTRYPHTGAVADISADAPYSMMVEFGRRKVTPSGKALFWQGSDGPVFSLSAAPVGEVPFMRNALDAVDE